MKILLPEKLEMTCTKCRETFTVRSSSIHGLESISCPFCKEASPITECLPTRVRRQIYHALRDEFEHRIYARHKELNPEASDQWSENAELE